MYICIYVYISNLKSDICAAELSQAGWSVLVIEKGNYYHESELTSHVPTEYKNIYLQGGSFANCKGDINVFEGSTFGSATVISFLDSLKFSDNLDKVYKRIGATTEGIKHIIPNRILIDGCNRKSHEYDWCLTGCKDGIKNGTSTSWLRTAAQNGAHLVGQAKFNRAIIVDGNATGVEFRINNSDQIIRLNSFRTVISAGSLRTQEVLFKSGLKDKSIGQNLRFHPLMVAYGFFDNSQTNPFEGSIMIAISGSIENLYGEYYRSKLVVLHHTTDIFIFGTSWQGQKEHKEAILKFRQSSSVPALVRDKDSKENVGYKKDDKISISYEISKIVLRNNSYCRMGVSPDTSATKPTGDTWETRNLYVCNASLFATTSGVNPIVTTEPIALHVADSIIQTANLN
ncbi:hypothetical protein J3Q64DRAFT_1702987 [Phycomyces blakesleeanus]|uniref:Glucose-methanol-choline oxidoreductase N-terminal domain-containing protein n=2 Tax=Phycomyces blakesleeanus TaxID=4837 RepID=A0A167LGF7_PHYB8|nr:hypothetical protein PHYBLDRAFT_171150 [Phycomyces blakesleeanus NRRL 1555(-)]OAD70398.1 hypothetical protein PHYBLDRAFT_171150 [Phycomyces blakesleeanus NRRL 1555(-)]|eukprot:XP_018288438.1 hypothetical protein PHYBLDRAFT_171150 [Phycomyces blakesleeanus NRRL 1555(-)]